MTAEAYMSEGAAFFKKYRRRIIVIAVIAAAVLVIAANLTSISAGLSAVAKVFSPVILGFAAAYVLNPIVSFFERTVFKKISRPSFRRNFSIFLTFVILIVLITLLLIALIPQLVSCVTNLLGNLNSFISKTSDLSAGLQEKASEVGLDISTLTSLGNELLGRIIDLFRSQSQTIVGTARDVGSGIVSFFIGIFIAIYCLADKDRIVRGSKKLFRKILAEDNYLKLHNFLSRCNRILTRYILCDLLDGLIIGAVNAVFMTVTRMPYVALVSVVVGITNLAPTFGPIIGLLTGAFLLVIVDPVKALIFVIFTLILQTIDGYVLKPKLFGNILGVSSLLILLMIVANLNDILRWLGYM